MAARPSLVIAGIVVVAAGAIAVWYLQRSDPASPVPPSTSGSAAAPAGVATPPASPPPRRATKISKDERARVVERIARARASREASAVPAGPSPSAAAPATPALPGDEQLEDVKTNVQAAMSEVIPFLVECAKQHREALGSTALVKASMMLDGDPDVGTLITADELQGDDGLALPAGFDDCMRDVLQSLQLPPLEEGSRFKVNYTFSFDTKPDDGSAGSAR